MNASDIGFGIEFETTIPNSDTTPIGGYHHGLQVAWLPEGWKAERDGSICPTAPNHKGCEFISPVLKGAEGIAQVEAALALINARGARVNASCGLHITVSWNGDAAALARLISLVGNHEKAIFASTGTRKREQATYTKQVKHYGCKEAAKARCEGDRYHVLNLTHLARGQKRIEFRAFAGTTSPVKVIGHLLMVLGLVELALKSTRCQGWDYLKPAGKATSWDRDGAGESELVRLFYRLGWIRGKTKGVFGIAGSPDLKAVKAELTRLAKKYDASAM